MLPSLMTAAGRGSLHDRGCSRPSVPDAGARERLRRGDVPTPPLLTSRSWCFSSPSVSSLRAEQLKASSFTVPRPSFCRSEGGTAKPCVCLRSWPAKKPVLGLGKMCPSSRPPGAAVQAAVAGDRAGRARGGAPSWMKRKEVFICCCSGRSAISCDGAGLVLAGVKLRSQCPGMQTLAAVGRRDLAPWIHWQPCKAGQRVGPGSSCWSERVDSICRASPSLPSLWYLCPLHSSLGVPGRWQHLSSLLHSCQQHGSGWPVELSIPKHRKTAGPRSTGPGGQS